MVSSNKVLTVSYGTFSCTLEGFDESFETMKAIAEYFRDLAADDRYFGAEPPTPDADMLARIAEREISRRVRAHEQGGQIVLRAGDTEAFVKAGAAEPAAAPKTAPEQPAPEQAETADTAEAPADTEAAEAQTPEAEPREEAPQDAAADQDTVAGQAPPAPERPEQPDTQQVAGDRHDATAEDTPAEEIEIVEPRAEDIPAGDSDADSVAARLRRIRSVVAQSGGRYGPDDYDEDEHANDFLSQTAAELEDALEADAAPQDMPADEARSPDGQESAAQEPEETPDDPFASLTARLLETEDDAQSIAPDATADEAEEEIADETAPEPEVAADRAEDTLAQLLADAMPDDAEAENATAQEDEAEAETPMVLDADAQLDDTAGAPDADTAEDAPGEHPTAPEPAGDDADEMQPEDALLSPEEEAELMQELAAVEAELGSGGTGTRPAAGQEDTAPEFMAAAADAERAAEDDAEETADAGTPGDHAEEAEARHAAAHLETPQEDWDVSRLFDEADSQLETPEASKRRNAIQHLRAAVAATRAEKKAGRDLREQNSDAPYRSDLASVVRPRRPHAGDSPAATERPRAQRRRAEERPAPLKLVAEQRVDTPREPVRPRRVSTAQLAAGSGTADDGGFSEYAKSIGASTLPELLEAAAAYMADVEGRDQFSRPMLMGKLKEAGHADFSREDGLRSFGNLLREGKLRKLKGGRFAVTDQTEFRARARHAG